MKRFLSFTFLFLVLVLFASCSSGIKGDQLGESSSVETAEPSTTLEIVKKGDSKYTIVHDGTQEAKDFSAQLSTYIKLKFAAELKIESEKESDGRYEIAVKQLESEAPVDFALAVEADRLCLSGKSRVSYNYLFEYLKREVLVRGTTADLTLTPSNNVQFSQSELSKVNFVDYLQEEEKSLDLNKIFEAGSFRHEKTDLLYRLYIPADYSPEKKYPIFVNLHGAGIRGSDNKRPLAFVKTLFQNETYGMDEFIVLVPQCPEQEKWVDITWADGSYDMNTVPESNEFQALVALIESLIKNYSVDEERIYAAGFSMGGYGTWNLLMNHPDLFAAGVPMCGAASPAHASTLLNTPVWAIHGVKDPTVPVSGSREMVEAIQALGGTLVKYTELPDHDHDVWNYTYKNEEIFTWLFSQRKGS